MFLLVALFRQNGLVIGGGQVARRNTEELLSYALWRMVVVPEIDLAIRAIPELHLAEWELCVKDLEKTGFVLVAAGHREVNLQAAELYGERRIPINIMDDQSLLRLHCFHADEKGTIVGGHFRGRQQPVSGNLSEKIHRTGTRVV